MYPLIGTGAPWWIRTTDPQLRRLLLYPTELRARRLQYLQNDSENRISEHGFKRRSDRIIRLCASYGAFRPCLECCVMLPGRVRHKRYQQTIGSLRWQNHQLLVGDHQRNAVRHPAPEQLHLI